MKISQRLILQTALAATAMIVVVGAGTYSLHVVGRDLHHLVSRVTPLKNALIQIDAAGERVVSAVLEMARARTTGELDEASARAARSRAELAAQREKAASYDGRQGVGGRELEAFDEKVQGLVRRGIELRTEDSAAGVEASKNVMGTKVMSQRLQQGAQMVERQMAEEIDRARLDLASTVRGQRDALQIQFLLKDAESLVFALQDLEDYSKLRPLERRARDFLRDLGARASDPGVRALLDEIGFAPGEIRARLVDDGTGQFALRDKGFKGDAGASKTAETRLVELLESLGRQQTATRARIEEFAARASVQQERVDRLVEADKSGIDVRNEATALQQLVAAAEQSLAGVFLAQDRATLDEKLGRLRTDLEKIAANAAAIGKVLGDGGFPAYAVAARKLVEFAGKATEAVQRIAAARSGMIAAEGDLAATLSALREFVAGERTRTAEAIAAIDVRQAGISESVNADISWARGFMIALALTAIPALVVLSLMIVRSITSRLGHAVELARDVADGNLHRLEGEAGNDEIGELMRAMGRMVATLSEAVLRIREAARSVHRGVDEISGGNTDLTERTSSQAADLNETATSISQVSSIASEGARAAESAAQRSQAANHAAAQGREIMQQAMRSMADVQSGAEEIKNIIEVINSIAFQTNILALNAAVEAARAGEQGRGFAVVASEVRSLASKSADAAQEIGRIITSNVEQVEAGSALVNEAGDQIAAIAAEISETVALIQRISTGSVEQSAAVQQVDATVRQLEESTQRNAALAEQIATSTRLLVDQANSLEHAVDVFRVAHVPE